MRGRYRDLCGEADLFSRGRLLRYFTTACNGHKTPMSLPGANSGEFFLARVAFFESRVTWVIQVLRVV